MPYTTRLEAQQIIHDDEVAQAAFVRQVLLGPTDEELVVEGAFDAQRCDKSVRTRCSREGRRPPTSRPKEEHNKESAAS